MTARIRRWFEDRGEPLPWFAIRAGAEPDHVSLFDGKDARAILRRLAEDDPLQLGKLASLVASDEARLVHPDRLTARACAQVAYRAAADSPVTPSLIGWLRSQTQRCLEDLLEEDDEEERRRLPLGPEMMAEFAQLIPAETGIEPELTRLATILFNRFPLQDRVPFYRCAIEAFSVEAVAQDLSASVRAVRSRIERVTERLVMQVETVRERRSKE